MPSPVTQADRIVCPHGVRVFPPSTSRLRVDDVLCHVGGVRFEISGCTAEPACATGLFDPEGPLEEDGLTVLLHGTIGGAYDADGEWIGDLTIEGDGSGALFIRSS